jgi:hypothetical protein
MKYLIYIFFIFLMFDIATAFEIDSPTYTIYNSHLGSVGGTGESSTFSIRSTTTFEQGGNQEASSSSFTLNIGHYFLNETFIPIINRGIWQITSATGMTYKSGDTMKSVIQLRNQSNIYINDKYCDVLYRYPNNTIWINWTVMPGISESTGVYYYNTTTLPLEGIYTVEYRCKEVATNEIKAYAIENIYVSSWANEIDNISSSIDDLNTSLSDINNNLNNISDIVNTINTNVIAINTSLNYLNISINNINNLVINLNDSITEIYNLLFGINTSNPNPPDVEIIYLAGDGHYKFTPSSFLQVNLDSTSLGNINYTKIRIINPNSFLIYQYENTTLNSSSLIVNEEFNSYDFIYGNYTILAESTDVLGNYGADIGYFQVDNRAPEEITIISPNSSSTYTDLLPISWTNNLDPDRDSQSIYLEYSLDSGSNWNSLVNLDVSDTYVDHTCSINSSNATMQGNFTLLAEFNLDQLIFTLNKSDVYYLYLNNSINTTISKEAVCAINEECTFIFDSPVFEAGNYSWVIRFANSGILADGYHCNKSIDEMVAGGLQSNIIMQATPSTSLYNLNISSYTTSANYLLRMRSFDSLLYSNWTETISEFTIIKTTTTPSSSSGSSGNLGEGIINDTIAEDFMFCNLETGECFNRDDIFSEPQTSEQTVFSLVGAGDFSGGLKILTASFTKTVNKVGDFGEGFGIPAFIFIFLVIILIVLSSYYFFGGKKENEINEC